MTQAAELERAIYAALNGTPASEEARAFVGGLTNGLVIHEWNTTGRVNQRGQKTRDKLAVVVSGFVFDLLVAAGKAEADGWVYRPMRTESFSDVGVSIKTFRPVVSMMVELGFIEPHEDNPISSSAKTKAARWRATDKLLGRKPISACGGFQRRRFRDSSSERGAWRWDATNSAILNGRRSSRIFPTSRAACRGSMIGAS